MTKGIAVTQEGIGISQALDAQKVLDSRWRYFEIAHEELLSTAVISFGKVTELFNHGLGFLPAFDCYDITSDGYIISDISGGLRADRTRIYFDGENGNNINYSNHKVLLRVYNVPITEEYKAPIQKTLPSKTTAPTSVGVKIAPGTTSFNTFELSKFSINTSGKALAIQKTGLVTANSGTNNEAVVVHDLGNPPIFLAAYASPTRQWVSALNPSFIPVLAKANASTLTFSGAQGALSGTLAYIIFKELGEFAI
jgi:hypothetical protein